MHSSGCRTGTAGASCSSSRTSSSRTGRLEGADQGPLGESWWITAPAPSGTCTRSPPAASTCTPATQLEISSTELRQLIIAGRDPRYLVPDEVRQIIRETRCYAPEQALHEPHRARPQSGDTHLST